MPFSNSTRTHFPELMCTPSERWQKTVSDTHFKLAEWCSRWWAIEHTKRWNPVKSAVLGAFCSKCGKNAWIAWLFTPQWLHRSASLKCGFSTILCHLSDGVHSSSEKLVFLKLKNGTSTVPTIYSIHNSGIILYEVFMLQYPIWYPKLPNCHLHLKGVLNTPRVRNQSRGMQYFCMFAAAHSHNISTTVALMLLELCWCKNTELMNMEYRESLMW